MVSTLASTTVLRKLAHRTAHDEIGITRTAFRTAQQPRPIRNGHSRAMLRDVVGHPVITGFAPYDKPDVRSERRAQRDALRLAFASLRCHIQVNASAPI